MIAELLKRIEAMHIRWFGEEDIVDEVVDDDDASKGKDDDDIKDDAVDELKVENLTEPELKLLVKKLAVNNKKLADLSRERLHEIMEKKNKLKEVEKKEDEVKNKALLEKEEFKKLYDDLKPRYDVLEKDVSRTHEMLGVEIDELKTELSEEYHQLIPNTDVREQIKWIKNFNKILKKEDVSKQGEKKNSVNTSITSKHIEKGKTSDEIEKQIRNCTSSDEMEKLLEGYKRAGK